MRSLRPSSSISWSSRHLRACTRRLPLPLRPSGWPRWSRSRRRAMRRVPQPSPRSGRPPGSGSTGGSTRTSDICARSRSRHGRPASTSTSRSTPSGGMRSRAPPGCARRPRTPRGGPGLLDDGAVAAPCVLRGAGRAVIVVRARARRGGGPYPRLARAWLARGGARGHGTVGRASPPWRRRRASAARARPRAGPARRVAARTARGGRSSRAGRAGGPAPRLRRRGCSGDGRPRCGRAGRARAGHLGGVGIVRMASCSP